MTDIINHPPHYKSNGMEAIDVIEAFELPYNLGNAAKYILRAGRKNDRNEDLKKAVWYIQREIGSTETTAADLIEHTDFWMKPPKALREYPPHDPAFFDAGWVPHHGYHP